MTTYSPPPTQRPEPHPLCQLLRQLRRASGLTLRDMERHGISSVLMGSYERGDRIPPLPKLEALLNRFGYKLMAVPDNEDAVRRPTDMVAELRAIADMLEKTGQGEKLTLQEVREKYPPAE